MSFDPYQHNRDAWNLEVSRHNEWTRPVGPDVIARARQGDWQVLLTPTTPVPRAWFGELAGRDVLALASGGGQQGPTLAAAGARVTVCDASEAQLAQDELVAKRDGLTSLKTVRGDMRRLTAFSDASFDLVFNPCSTCFVDDVEAVWREVARVLRPGGVLLTGFVNPWFYLFDPDAFDRGELVVTRALPYRAHEHPESVQAGQTMEYSHSFEAQLGGQLRAGLVLTDLFEDGWPAWAPLDAKAKAFLATRAVKAR